MKINRKKIIILVTFLAILIFASYSLNSFKAKSILNESLINDVLEQIEDEYLLNTTLEIPALDHKYEGVEPLSIIVYPNGRAITKNTVLLDQEGIYKLRYEYHKDLKVIKRYEKEFIVYQNNFVVQGQGDVSYHEERLSVSLKEGDVLKLNQSLLVSNLTSRNFITLRILPKVNNEIDFGQITFKLIDLLNDENFIMINVRNSPDSIVQADPDLYKGYSYALGSSREQTPSGYEPHTNIVHRNNEWGANVPLSFWGIESRNRLNVSFNAESGVITANNSFVINVKSAEYFTELWEGFEANLVRLEITCENYYSDTGYFEIENIVGIDLAKEKNIITQEPEITILENKIPDALVGQEYPLFTAVARDGNLKDVSVNSKVYYNYLDDQNRYEISITNNKFIPPKKGIYTVVYTATDIYGNKGLKAIEIEAFDSINRIEVMPIDDLGIREGNVGELIYINQVVFSGGSGDKELKITAISPHEHQDITGKNYFIANYEGEYLIVYTVTDYLGKTGSYMYQVAVDYSESPVFTKIPEVSTVWQAGYRQDLKLADFEAYLFTPDGKEKAAVDVRVTIDNLECEIIDGYVEIPDYLTEKTAQLVYRAGESEKTFEVTVLPPRDENENILFENFFMKEGNIEIETLADYVQVSFNENGSITFVNSLVFNGLTMNLNIEEIINNNSTFEIYFEDLINPDEYLKFVFVKMASSMFVSINEQKQIQISLDYKKDVEFLFERNKIVVGNSALSLGDLGLSSGKAIVTFKVRQVGLGTSLKIYSFARQNFKLGALDNVSPQLDILDELSVLKKIDEVVETPKIIGANVLNPHLSLTISVVGPDQENVLDLNGLMLREVTADQKYQIKLDQYGEYVVSIVGRNVKTGRTSRRIIRYVVENKEIPELKYEFKINKTGKINDNIAVPRGFVDKSLEPDCTVSRFLILPNQQLINFEQEYYDSFIAKNKGKYAVRYHVIDINGNFAIEDFIVEIS